jgi:hypothetical protein
MRHENIEIAKKHWSGFVALGLFFMAGYAYRAYEGDLNSVNTIMNDVTSTNTALTQADRKDIATDTGDSRSDSELALGSAVVGTVFLTIEGMSVLSRLGKYPPSDKSF